MRFSLYNNYQSNTQKFCEKDHENIFVFSKQGEIYHQNGPKKYLEMALQGEGNMAYYLLMCDCQINSKIIYAKFVEKN